MRILQIRSTACSSATTICAIERISTCCFRADLSTGSSASVHRLKGPKAPRDGPAAGPQTETPSGGTQLSPSSVSRFHGGLRCNVWTQENSRMHCKTLAACLLAVLSLSAQTPKFTIHYTGKLLGYPRIPDVQRAHQ